jgi:hypothetical protein
MSKVKELEKRVSDLEAKFWVAVGIAVAHTVNAKPGLETVVSEIDKLAAAPEEQKRRAKELAQEVWPGAHRHPGSETVKDGGFMN